MDDKERQEQQQQQQLEQQRTIQQFELDRPSSGATYRVYKRRWFGLVGLMLMNIVISWDWLTYAPVADVTQEWFNLSSPTPVNWLSTAILFTFAIASPFSLYALNAHGFRPAITAASALVFLGNWVRYGSTLRKSYGGVMFGQVLIGLAQPFVLASPTYYSDLWFTSRGRVSATALASLSNPFGAALGQLVNPMIAPDAAHVPRMTLWVALIASVASAPWAFVPARPPLPPCASASGPKMDVRSALQSVFTNREFVLVFVLFTVYLGFFNAMSSMLNQIMEAYGYTAEQAGIMGAVLILSGLVSSAIVSPLIDRTHTFLIAIKSFVPIIAACYIALIFAPLSHSLPAPYLVAALLGACSFCLLPLSLEYVVEITHPAPPELTSAVLWVGGSLSGAGFLLGMDALAGGGMRRALVFEAVIATAVVPCVFFIRKGVNRRIEIDRQAG